MEVSVSWEDEIGSQEPPEEKGHDEHSKASLGPSKSYNIIVQNSSHS